MQIVQMNHGSIGRYHVAERHPCPYQRSGGFAEGLNQEVEDPAAQQSAEVLVVAVVERRRIQTLSGCNLVTAAQAYQVSFPAGPEPQKTAAMCSMRVR
jgi:hypothetical protein